MTQDQRAALEAQIELPSWHEAERNCLRNNETPLDRFIFDNEPSECDQEWRDQLEAVIAEAIAHDRQQRGEPVAVADLPSFPTMLRKMWSGGEVQEWINDNLKPLFQERHHDYHCAPQPAEPAGTLQKGDMRVIDGKTWACTDPDIDRWVCTEPATKLPDDSKTRIVPGGWKLVPVEMTVEMLTAGAGTGGLGMNYHEWVGRVSSAWRSMLEAAPTPPADQPEGTRPPEIQAAWHSGWDAAQEAWKAKSLPVTPQEDEAREELERRQ